MKITPVSFALVLTMFFIFGIEAKPSEDRSITGNYTDTTVPPTGKCIRICFDHGLDMVGKCKEKCEEDEKEIHGECQIACPPGGCRRRFSCLCCAKKKQK
ncbi:uncharacterized protein [Palaemon carinicauda]|uniref:uncharacterized protein n=1 Tax=Palaemon carinicauda TaxID=392227 RepID=UPI0035B5AF5F